MGLWSDVVMEFIVFSSKFKSSKIPTTAGRR